MKRRSDCLELQRKLHQIEEAMKPGYAEFDALRKILRDVDKSDLEITKTLYWSWLTEKGDFPETFFYNTPPIGEAQESNRILITGTKVETRDMYEILKGLEAYKRVIKVLQDKRLKLPASKNETLLKGHEEQPSNELILATRSLQEYGVTPEYIFSARVGSFWEQFFCQDNFLDNIDKISVPLAIIGTGFMRNYNQYGGETMDVKGRLEEIASAWDIPIQIINSWAP